MYVEEKRPQQETLPLRAYSEVDKRDHILLSHSEVAFPQASDSKYKNLCLFFKGCDGITGPSVFGPTPMLMQCCQFFRPKW